MCKHCNHSYYEAYGYNLAYVLHFIEGLKQSKHEVTDDQLQHILNCLMNIHNGADQG